MFEGKFELKFILTFRVSVETCSGVTERLKFLPLKQSDFFYNMDQVACLFEGVLCLIFSKLSRRVCLLGI